MHYSIPSHHPSVPGSVASAAVLTTIWDHLRRLATHILENDANTTETLGNLMSEAALDGCLPFNSHLHMDFGSAWLQRHSTPTQYQAIWDSWFRPSVLFSSKCRLALLLRSVYYIIFKMEQFCYNRQQTRKEKMPNSECKLGMNREFVLSAFSRGKLMKSECLLG